MNRCKVRGDALRQEAESALNEMMVRRQPLLYGVPGSFLLLPNPPQSTDTPTLWGPVVFILLLTHPPAGRRVLTGSRWEEEREE